MTLSNNPYDRLTDSTALNNNVVVLDRSDEEKKQNALSIKESRVMYKVKLCSISGVIGLVIGFGLGWLIGL